MNTDVCFDSGVVTTKEINWNQPIVELNKLWHTGKPERSGIYIVLYDHAYWFANYNCENNTFIIQMNGTIGFEKEVKKWRLFL